MIDPRKFNEFLKLYTEAKLLTSGELDAEYKKVSEKIAEWDKRNNLPAVTARLEQDKSDLAVNAAAHKKEVEKHDTAVKSWNEYWKQKEDERKAAEQKLAADRASFDTAKAEHEATIASLKAGLAARSAELDQKHAAADEMQRVLAAEHKTLTDKQGKVNEAMKTLSALQH